MDESLQELENELKRLPPRKPSAQLLAALEAGLADHVSGKDGARIPAVTGLALWPWLNWRTTAAVAAVLAFASVLITARRPVSRAPDVAASPPVIAVAAPAVGEAPPALEPIVLAVEPAPDRYRPVGAASVLYDLREDGAVSQQNRTPVRRLRYRYVDTYTWKNPATHASLKWSLPRDEVRVLPASLH